MLLELSFSSPFSTCDDSRSEYSRTRSPRTLSTSRPFPLPGVIDGFAFLHSRIFHHTLCNLRVCQQQSHSSIPQPKQTQTTPGAYQHEEAFKRISGRAVLWYAENFSMWTNGFVSRYTPISWRKSCFSLCRTSLPSLRQNILLSPTISPTWLSVILPIRDIRPRPSFSRPGMPRANGHH